MAIFGGDAQHGDFAAVAHVGEHVAEAGGVAGHLQAHVEAFLMPSFFWTSGEVRSRMLTAWCAHFAGQRRDGIR
jgi:hypothetical protein